MDMARTYRAEERAAGLALYVEHGLAVAHQETGVPKSTLQFWARADGLNLAEIGGKHAERTLAATAARSRRCDAMRAEIGEQMLENVGALLSRIDMVHIEYRGKDVVQVEYPWAPASAVRDYVWATAVLIDKYRLEVGEVTGRTELLEVTPAANERLARIVELVTDRQVS